MSHLSLQRNAATTYKDALVADVAAVYAQDKYTFGVLWDGTTYFVIGGQGRPSDAVSLKQLRAGACKDWLPVHRSALINPAFVRGGIKRDGGLFALVRVGASDREYPVSQRYRATFLAWLAERGVSCKSAA